MFGLGPIELFMSMFFWILPIAFLVAFVVVFLKWISRISRDISQISKSMQNIEAKLTRNE
jgi:hypothetical protein